MLRFRFRARFVKNYLGNKNENITKCLCPSEFRAKERASSWALKRKIADFTLTRRTISE